MTARDQALELLGAEALALAEGWLGRDWEGQDLGQRGLLLVRGHRTLHVQRDRRGGAMRLAVAVREPADASTIWISGGPVYPATEQVAPLLTALLSNWRGWLAEELRAVEQAVGRDEGRGQL